MEHMVKQYKDRGKLIFSDRTEAAVDYEINEYQEYVSDGLGGQIATLRDRRGHVTHAEGHPAWHPIVPLTLDPATLVMKDSRKLKVLLQDELGTVQATGDFF